MARQTVEISAGELGEALTSQLSEKPTPDERVRVTVESVPDYSGIPDDVLESQRAGLRSRMEAGDRASEKEVDGLFKKWA